MKPITPLKDLEIPNCPRCNYSLRELTGTRCPECGGDAKLFAQLRTAIDQQCDFVERCSVGAGHGLYLVGFIALLSAMGQASSLTYLFGCALFVVMGLILFVWWRMEDWHPAATLFIGTICAGFGISALYFST